MFLHNSWLWRKGTKCNQQPKLTLAHLPVQGRDHCVSGGTFRALYLHFNVFICTLVNDGGSKSNSSQWLGVGAYFMAVQFQKTP